MVTIEIIEVREVQTFKCEIRGDRHQCCKFPEGTSFEAILEVFHPKSWYYEAERRAEVDRIDANIIALLAHSRKLLAQMDIDGWGDDAVLDDDCILLGDDDCLIIEDARTETRDDDCILLGDDECLIVENA
jgi:hypothetical protein